MPHIQLDTDAPGIRSLALYRPETGKSLYELAQALLRAGSPDSTLTDAERELLAAYVSSQNRTDFCMNSHAAASRYSTPISIRLSTKRWRTRIQPRFRPN